MTYKYSGAATIPGVPARDLTDEEHAQYVAEGLIVLEHEVVEVGDEGEPKIDAAGNPITKRVPTPHVQLYERIKPARAASEPADGESGG